jgi:putative transposase
MKRSKFSEQQIISILKQAENGRTVAEVCREAGVSTATYFKWKSKYGGMEASDIRRMRELEEENRQLQRMYADVSLECRALKDVIEKKPWSR